MMRWMLVLLVLVAAAAAMSFMSGGIDNASSGPVAAAQAQPRYSVRGARWTRLDETGNPELRAEAATLDYYADESVRLTDLTLGSLGGDTSPWTMTAPAGQVPAHERRVLLTGTVAANGRYGDEPVSFTTDRLWVDLLRRELRTESSVLLESDFQRASARGLRADFAGESVQLLDDVRVEYVPGS